MNRKETLELQSLKTRQLEITNRLRTLREEFTRNFKRIEQLEPPKTQEERTAEYAARREKNMEYLRNRPYLRKVTRDKRGMEVEAKP